VAGRTKLSELVHATTALREKGRQVFGVVLWDAPPPRLTARPKRTLGGRRNAPKDGKRVDLGALPVAPIISSITVSK
jgi:hypothetical protein